MSFDVLIIVWLTFSHVDCQSCVIDGSLPVAINAHQTAYDAPSHNIYLFGGSITGGYLVNTIYKRNMNQTDWIELNEVTPWTISTGFFTWTQNAVTINRVVYFVGMKDTGYTSGKVYLFDLDTEKWLNNNGIMAVLHPSTYGCLTENTTHLFMIGGMSSSSSFDDYLQIYDINDNYWIDELINISPIEGNGWMGQYCYIHNELYVFGGYVGTIGRIDSILKYNPTGKWSLLSSVLPSIASSGATVFKDPYIYIIGGWNKVVSLDTILEFNIQTESITNIYYMQERRDSTDAEIINNDIYIFGGSPDGSTTSVASNTIELCDIFTAVDTSNPSKAPSQDPSTPPSNNPSTEPSVYPSNMPSKQPSTEPFQEPSNVSYKEPSTQPSPEPSKDPSKAPSNEPTKDPSKAPSNEPTIFPIECAQNVTLTIFFNYTENSETETQETLLNITETFIENEMDKSIMTDADCKRSHDYGLDIASQDEYVAIINVLLCFQCNNKETLSVDFKSNSLEVDFIEFVHDSTEILIAVIKIEIILSESELSEITTSAMTVIKDKNTTTKDKVSDVVWMVLTVVFIPAFLFCVGIIVCFCIKRKRLKTIQTQMNPVFNTGNNDDVTTVHPDIERMPEAAPGAEVMRGENGMGVFAVVERRTTEGGEPDPEGNNQKITTNAKKPSAGGFTTKGVTIIPNGDTNGKGDTQAQTKGIIVSADDIYYHGAADA